MNIRDTFNIIFDTRNIDWECSKIAHLIDEYVLNHVEEMLDAECYQTAIEQFLAVTEACCEHFVEESTGRSSMICMILIIRCRLPMIGLSGQ